MDPALRDAFGHEAWANIALIAFCEERLTPEQLRATTPGAYAGVAETIGHHLGAVAWYQHRLGLERLAWEEASDDDVGVDELRRRAEEVAGRWERLLHGGIDLDAVVENVEEDGSVERIPAAVYVAQTFNHGSEHRDQVCTILTTLGIRPPELDVWAYAYATGRVRAEPRPTV